MTTLGGNLTETLFDQNLKFTNINDDNNMEDLMPAYLQQAHLSTYYQDDPLSILVTPYGEPLGGPVDLQLPPGYRPGNIVDIPKPQITREKFRSNKEMFGNENQKSTNEEPNWFSTPQGLAVIFLIIVLLLGAGYMFYIRKNDRN